MLKLALFATSVAPKWCQNAPQRPQNTSKIDPKSTQNCPLAHPGAPRWNQNPILSFWDRFWSPIWSPLAAKIDQESMLCEKNAQRSALSKQCLPGAVHHLIFCTFFGHFWSKNDEKIITLLCVLLVFPTLEKPCILQATLLVDSVFANTLKY